MLQLEELSRPNVSLALNYTLRSFPAIAIRSIILALSDENSRCSLKNVTMIAFLVDMFEHFGRDS